MISFIYEVSRIDKSPETERRLTVSLAGGQGVWGAGNSRIQVSFGGDEDVLKWTGCEYTANL